MSMAFGWSSQGILRILSIQALGEQQFVAAPFAAVLVPHIDALT